MTLWTIPAKRFGISLASGGFASLEIYGPFTSEDVDDIEQTLVLAVKSLRRRLDNAPTFPRAAEFEQPIPERLEGKS